MKLEKYLNEDIHKDFNEFKKKSLKILKNMEIEVQTLDSLHEDMFYSIEDQYAKKHDDYNFDREIRRLDAIVSDFLMRLKRG